VAAGEVLAAVPTPPRKSKMPCMMSVPVFPVGAAGGAAPGGTVPPAVCCS
jgi:hypothetical protein